MKIIHNKMLFALLLMGAALLCGTEAAGQALPVTRLAILPLAAGSAPLDSNRQVLDCREPELIVEGKPSAGGQEQITNCLQQALEREMPGRLVPQNERAGADELLAFMKKNDSVKAHAVKLGEKLQASHVLAGTALRYRERKGTAYGADKPAAVAFSVYLLDVKTGDMLWSGAFDKVQQSLSENLLDAPSFFKGGAKWLTAEELACQGAADIAQKLKLAVSGKGGK